MKYGQDISFNHIIRDAPYPLVRIMLAYAESPNLSACAKCYILGRVIEIAKRDGCPSYFDRGIYEDWYDSVVLLYDIYTELCRQKYRNNNNN
ncbi:MAG: hypothetical protein KatS3mg083_139 [Candidatus Dojkabacteria bacterium]|nr:MAG: hypothetical protein KatS3mg083_139 [Candidatus Dojkabacteria bacterium]